jgi:hypothetical protein
MTPCCTWSNPIMSSCPPAMKTRTIAVAATMRVTTAATAAATTSLAAATMRRTAAASGGASTGALEKPRAGASQPE